MVTRNAADLVALAKRAAHERIDGAQRFGLGCRLQVHANGEAVIVNVASPVRRTDVVMSVDLAPAYTVSEDALVRELLGSAPMRCERVDAGFSWTIAGVTGVGHNRGAAREACIDALLARTEVGLPPLDPSTFEDKTLSRIAPTAIVPNIIALTKRAAEAGLATAVFALRDSHGDPMEFRVYTDGTFHAVAPRTVRSSTIALSVILTPANTASVEALYLALLDSADCDGCYHALCAHDESGCTHERDASDGVNISAMRCACEAAVLAMEVAACA